jgi:hypothetical protein
MKSWAGILSRTKGVATCALSLLLLVTPVCSAFCKFQACEAPKTAGESPCHESAGAVTSEHGSDSFGSERSCALEELPVVLPANFRGPSSDLPGPMSAANQLVAAEFSATCKFLLPARFSAFDDSPGSHSLENAFASAAIPLRI